MNFNSTPVPFPTKSLVVLISLSLSTPSWAAALEEVIVTAQKRAESLQTVPISVAAVAGPKLDEAGVQNIEDLTQLVPNIHLTQTGLSTQMRVRGIGSDNSQGFEQSVGVYKNNIHFSRAQLLRAPIFDMERVEVLRGPQGTLFGKNSIAGALNLITARPTDEFAASLDTSYETNFSTQEVTGVVSGPLNDSLKGRVALRWYDDPGYFTNSTLNQDQAEQNNTAGRVSLDWQPIDQLSVKYTGEQDTFDIKGRNLEIVVDLPSKHPNPALAGKTYSQIATLFGYQSFESSEQYVRQSDVPEFSDNKVNSHSLAADWSLPTFTLSSVTGLVKYDYNENCDCDFSPVNILSLSLNEDYEQISQELRATSDTNGAIKWLGGVFYQTYEQNFNDQFAVNSSSILFKAIPTLPAAFGNTGVKREFSQSSDSWAVFGQVDWAMTEKATLILGGRYTEETKDSHKRLSVTNMTGEPLTNPMQVVVAAAAYKQVFKTDTVQTPLVPNPMTGMPAYPGHQGHNLNKERDESAFTPSLKVQYDATDETMTYLSYSKGFKAGGFDPRSNSNLAFEFSEEEANAYEAGIKTRFNEDKVELNVALYRTDYRNLQISQFDGSVGFNVGNAKDTQVQGLELDGRWLLSDHLTANYSVALLDFVYKDFKNGNCNKVQLDAGEGSDSNGDGVKECDYTDKRGVYTPKYTVNGGFDYARELAGLDFTTTLDLQFIDSHQVHVNLDPKGEIDAYTLVGLRFGLAGQKWKVAIAGDNLLDEYVATYMANAPLSDTAFRTDTNYAFIRRPRTFTLSAGLKF